MFSNPLLNIFKMQIKIQRLYLGKYFYASITRSNKSIEIFLKLFAAFAPKIDFQIYLPKK